MGEDLKNRPAETAVLDTVIFKQLPHATPRKGGRPLGRRNRDVAEKLKRSADWKHPPFLMGIYERTDPVIRHRSL